MLQAQEDLEMDQRVQEEALGKMNKCVFCGGETHDFMGVHLIKNDGTIDFYCSSKCRKNSLKLNRDKRNMKWTAAYKDKLKATAERAALQANKSSEVVVTKPADKKKK